MFKQVSSTIALMGVTASLVACSPSPEAAQPVKLGKLDCVADNVDKKLFKSHIVLACDFVDVNGNNAGLYKATINRAGLDVGNIETNKITWIVGTVGDPKNTKLDGSYGGAAVGASVVKGAGANWLIGGFNGKISLQPYSVEGKSGLGFSLGGQKLVLKGM